MSTPPMAQTPVTILDVYTKQIEFGGRLEVIQEQLKPIQDHESRIRSLESARAKVIGGAITAGTLFGGVAGWVTVLLSRR